MTDITALLGAEAESLLSHQCRGIPASMLHLPGPDYVDRVVAGVTAGSGRTTRLSSAPDQIRTPHRVKRRSTP